MVEDFTERVHRQAEEQGRKTVSLKDTSLDFDAVYFCGALVMVEVDGGSPLLHFSLYCIDDGWVDLV